MKNPEVRTVVDGCDYRIEYTPDGDVVWVYDVHGALVGSIEYDHEVEAMYVSYHDPEQGVIATDSVSTTLNPELRDPEELARWLVSTHPANG